MLDNKLSILPNMSKFVRPVMTHHITAAFEWLSTKRSDSGTIFYTSTYAAILYLGH
jgi:hypothetical protein